MFRAEPAGREPKRAGGGGPAERGVPTRAGDQQVELSTTDAGAIYVFDDDHQEFRLRATFGMSEAMIAAISDRHIGMGDSNIGEAARRREPMQIADLREAPASAV